jgi:hypothetical protein
VGGEPCSGLGSVALQTGFNATIVSVYGGYSSVAERLSVAQDVEGSIPSSRPNLRGPQGAP